MFQYSLVLELKEKVIWDAISMRYCDGRDGFVLWRFGVMEKRPSNGELGVRIYGSTMVLCCNQCCCVMEVCKKNAVNGDCVCWLMMLAMVMFVLRVLEAL